MKISNRSVFHDYAITERYEAGIKLTGPEVKSIKTGRVSLKGAFVRLINSEAYLINASIQPYEYARIEKYDPQRTRKLLLNKRELISIKSKLDSSALVLVPVSLYTHHGLIKVEIGLGKGKKQFEKRELLKKRAQKRELERVWKGKIK